MNEANGHKCKNGNAVGRYLFLPIATMAKSKMTYALFFFKTTVSITIPNTIYF